MDFHFPSKPPAFQIMLKPIGPICNLDCTYCYYLEKSQLFPEKTNFKMQEDLLEKFVKEYIEAQDVPVVSFVWQGGEPSMMGVDYYRKAVELQNKYKGNKRIENSFQTNGTLLDDEFCHFFRENNFLIGISIDGPEHVHDSYRLDKQGNPTWKKVMRGVELLQKHKVEFNTLSVVNKVSSEYPLEVYRFLKEIGSTFIQFIPIVERLAEDNPEDNMLLVHQKYKGEAQLTEWSVSSKQYGVFLNTIFDEWVRNDVGRYFVQMFDVTLANYMGAMPGLCIFSETCGTAAVMEHNGDVFTCDHFVYDDHYLGNLRETPISSMMSFPEQSMFGQDKKAKLPPYCFACDYRFACNGGCPKQRWTNTPQGDPGLNYLCEGYKLFFEHSKPYFEFMAKELKEERPPANVMRWIRNKEQQAKPKPKVQLRRNDPCPCGSGKKFKNCHGK